MVSGFGTSYEPKDRKLIPGRLTAFRKFRFRPRPVFDGGTAIQEWTNFTTGAKPWERMPSRTWQMMGELSIRKGIEYAQRYYGANDWQPCLTAAGYGNVVYGAGEYEAVCATSYFKDRDEWDFHDAPQEDCSCGFWAYYTPEKIDTGNGNEWMATAAVEVWGDVVLGEKGVRAQKMRIVGLVAPKELLEAPIEIVQAWHKVVGELGVPQYWNRAEFLEFHPPQDVSELLPKRPEPPEYPYLNNDGAYVSTINRRQLWQYFSSMTTSAVGSNALYTASPVPTYSFLPSTYVEDACCVCKYKVTGKTQKDADKLMASHMLDKHMDWKGTSGTNP